jgi:hypothetical protein
LPKTILKCGGGRGGEKADVIHDEADEEEEDKE